MMSSKQLTPVGKAIGIIAVVGILVVACHLINGSYQSASDCSLAETYDYTSKKCVLKSASQYANEINNIELAQIKADTETKRRNGTLCIPAAEAKNYIGVNGCVRMVVQHYYIESYGWAWLDSGDESSVFSVAALDKGIIVRNDAEYYLGKIISVRGTIELYDGAPEIKISDKNAIFDIETQEEYVSQIQEMTDNIATNAQCNSLEDARKQCEWAKNNGLGNTGYCSTYNLLQRQVGNKCDGYTSKESTSDKRADCFSEKIKSARTKSQKDAMYQQCQNP